LPDTEENQKMKVVLFCGGMGMRLREFSDSVPKPMVNVGYRPILWHVMKYYAHFGHKDFILCLGWRGDHIKEYFMNYNEWVSNDFVLSSGGAVVDLLNSDIHDWHITFVDTGTRSNVGERLKAVEHLLDGEEVFLANYADGLTDLQLPDLIDFHRQQQAVGTFLAVRPSQSFHMVRMGPSGAVRQIQAAGEADLWVNGGYFVFGREIFDFLHEGEELVCEPLQRLIAADQLYAMKYSGFWSCMDTYKEKQHLDEMVAGGNTPWQVWNQQPQDVRRRLEPSQADNGNGRGRGTARSRASRSTVPYPR
jgi:glucose-1-phosphate cytidylyltransferase